MSLVSGEQQLNLEVRVDELQSLVDRSREEADDQA